MEYWSSSHLVYYCGKTIETTVTNNASVVDKWLSTNLYKSKTREKIIVGLDCKFKRHRIASMSNKIATLQLCVDTKCLMLQLFHINSIPIPLVNLLDDNKVTFFGVNVDENASKLWREYGLKFCNKMIDIRDMVKIWFPLSYRRECSLKSIGYEVGGLCMRKRKKVCGVDWESKVLDVELIEFAAVDAYDFYTIAHKLLVSS